MIKISVKPWIDGPLELLKHGLEHLNAEKDFDMRMALISIDNSVELMIKTYLKLPSRVTGNKGLSRAKYEEKTKYFSSILDSIEEIASEKLVGIELGDIEWYHGLRNQLYHDGMGITVAKEKVEGYAEIAKILFLNLFKLDVEDFIDMPHSLVGEFISFWALFEQELFRINAARVSGRKRFAPMGRIAHKLADDGVISQEFLEKFDSVRQFRNEVVHGLLIPSNDDLNKNIRYLEKLLSEIRYIE